MWLAALLKRGTSRLVHGEPGGARRGGVCMPSVSQPVTAEADSLSLPMGKPVVS